MYFFLAFAACSANHAKSFFPPTNQYRPTLRLGKAIQIFSLPQSNVVGKAVKVEKCIFAAFRGGIPVLFGKGEGVQQQNCSSIKKGGWDMAFLL